MPNYIDDPEFFVCDCCCHALAVWSEEDEDFVEFSLWETSVPELPLWERIKWAWRFILYGDAPGHHVLLVNKDLKKLRDRLNKEIERLDARS